MCTNGLYQCSIYCTNLKRLQFTKRFFVHSFVLKPFFLKKLILNFNDIFQTSFLRYGPAKESIWQYFVSKARDNLHIVLAMSPVGDELRIRLVIYSSSWLVLHCSTVEVENVVDDSETTNSQPVPVLHSFNES